MTNKYIDQLTVKEYEQIDLQLSYRLEQVAKEMQEGKASQKDYVDLRFLQHKIKNIIKKYRKEYWQIVNTII